MIRNRASSRRKHQQGGYALLLVVFLTALVLISTMSVGLRVLTEGRRQREEEMIWRGKQYTRGIKLYYRKFGRFPTSLDNLTKPQTGNIRFMRQAYTDPMNKEDGSWRLIYVGPAGQLIGSLKPPTSLQMPPAAGQPAGSPTPTASFGTAPASGIGITSTGASSGTPGATGSTAAGTGTSVANASGATGTDSQNIPTGDTPTIVGGNIIGVGSKINQSSILVYEKASNYRLFEFVWDPSKDMGLINSSNTGTIGTPAGSPGQPAAPAGPGMGTTNPPPTTPPNPNPNPQP